MEQFNLEKWLEDKSRKLVTRNNRPARIVCWDKLGDYPIIACIKYSDDYEDLESYDSSGYKYSFDREDQNDLFVADNEEGLTKFEKELQTIISDASHWTSDDGSISTYCQFGDEEIKKISGQLLDLAKKEILAWKKSSEKKDLEKHVAVLENDKVLLSNYLEEGDYYIELEDLKSLPKLEENES